MMTVQTKTQAHSEDKKRKKTNRSGMIHRLGQEVLNFSQKNNPFMKLLRKNKTLLRSLILRLLDLLL